MFRILNFPYSNSEEQKPKNVQTRKNMFQVSRKLAPNKPNNNNDNNNNPFPNRIIHSSQSRRSFSMKNIFLNNNRFVESRNKAQEQLFMVSKNNNNCMKKKQKDPFDSDSEEISV